MKTILVPVGGRDADHPVLATALLAARPLGAHLEFLHLRIPAATAAEYLPHIEFARGPGLRDSMDWLERNMATRSKGAAQHVRQFCARHRIPMRDTPGRVGVSASWREVGVETMQQLVLRARHNDAVVLSRPVPVSDVPEDLHEKILLSCGRPVLLVPRRAPERLVGTVMVCWRETAEAARALGAALPLLKRSKHVVVVAVGDDRSERDGPVDVAGQLAWHGIRAEGHWIAADGKSVAARLDEKAGAIDADLIVLSAYGHSRTREAVFDGCTRHFLNGSDRALLLLH